LKSTFLQHLNHCSSHADRQLRNDIFVIISLVISKCVDAPLIESGLVKLIAAYASYPEVPTRDPSIHQLQLAKHPEDFELKKLFFSAVNILCLKNDSPLVLDYLSRSQVMMALFAYAVPINPSIETEWSLAEFEELQLHAMSVLAAYAPLCLADYDIFQGSSRLLRMLDWCINTGSWIIFLLENKRNHKFFGINILLKNAQNEHIHTCSLF